MLGEAVRPGAIAGAESAFEIAPDDIIKLSLNARNHLNSAPCDDSSGIVTDIPDNEACHRVSLQKIGPVPVLPSGVGDDKCPLDLSSVKLYDRAVRATTKA